MAARERSRRDETQRFPVSGALPPWGVAVFAAGTGLLAIFFDAALGHGLLWENDPYWTYWVTKTFLIATIFGLGTAWLGIGEGRGAIIAAVHTVVLTVYYWTFSPIGLPSSPEWLDLEHTWLTGVPVHFGVIYLGYLVTLWVWRRAARGEVAAGVAEDSARLGLEALVGGLVIVVLAGGIASLATGEFPGFTWFLVRTLATVTFLLLWWGLVGRDALAAIAGAVVLALIWASYGQFVGPSGLPDTPLRVFDRSPPPATAEWMSYQDLWLISFPCYLVVMLVIFAADSARVGGFGGLRRPGMATAALALPLLIAGLAAPLQAEDGQEEEITASGATQFETGDFYSDEFVEGQGDIRVRTVDQGSRVSPLPPHDEIDLQATVEAEGATYEVTSQAALVSHPLGEHTTWWGVGYFVEHHGDSGIGTDKLPTIDSEVAAFGLGDVSVDGEVVAVGVPVHVMTAEDGLPGDATLELDVGSEQGSPIPGLPAGHLRVLWQEYEGDVSETGELVRYAVGSLVIAALVLVAILLVRAEARRGPSGTRRNG